MSTKEQVPTAAAGAGYAAGTHDAAAAALLVLCRELLPVWERHLATSRSNAEHAVSGMLAAVSSLQEWLTASAQSGGGLPIPPEIMDPMYLGLQYQDRINQQLALLQDDIARLHELVAPAQPDAQAMESKAWLNRLQSKYVTAEQHGDHAGLGIADNNQATTFF